MILPQIKPYDDQAIDAVVAVLNSAKFKIGNRQNLFQLAQSRYDFTSKEKVSLNGLKNPLAKNCEEFLFETLDKTWNLTPSVAYIIAFMGSSQDECSQYFYYEVVFSQPSVTYPIPQATATVYFRVQDDHFEHPKVKGVPMIIFRIEGQHSNHDIRFVTLTADWILSVLQMKLKLFKRLEELEVF